MLLLLYVVGFIGLCWTCLDPLAPVLRDLLAHVISEQELRGVGGCFIVICNKYSPMLENRVKVKGKNTKLCTYLLA